MIGQNQNIGINNLILSIHLFIVSLVSSCFPFIVFCNSVSQQEPLNSILKLSAFYFQCFSLFILTVIFSKIGNSDQPYSRLSDPIFGVEKISETEMAPKDGWTKVTAPLKATSKWCNYVSSRRKNVNRKLSKVIAIFREGPAPREERKRNATFENLNSTLRGIDSDINDDEEEETINQNNSFTTDVTASFEGKSSSIKQSTKTANSRALIYYFSKLAGSSNMEDMVDLDFVEGLIDNGADINVTDKHGQTLFHEVARAWHIDVAKFLIEKDADINKADKFGRTPLHVASAVNYPDMVEFLLQNGGMYYVKSHARKDCLLSYYFF